MNQEHIRALLLDDDDHYRQSMAATLRVAFGFQVEEAADGQSAVQQVIDSGGEYDVILIDQHLTGDSDGVAVLSEIRQTYPEIECVILTGYAPEDRERAIAAGAFRYIEKLFVNHNELALLIRAAAQQARTRAISRDILSRLEREDALRQILGAVTSLLEADDAAIALSDDEVGRWEWFCLHPPSGDRDECTPLHNDRLADEIRRSLRPVSIQHLQDDTRHESWAKLGFASFAAMPVPGKSAALGALFALSRRPEHFDVDRRGRLNELATMAGLALDNAQIFKKTRDLAGYMGAVTATNFKLAQTTDRDTLLQLAWEFVNAELKVATFFVALYDPESGQVSYPVMWDEDQPKVEPPFTLADDKRITAHVIRTGEEYYWPTPDDKARYCESANIVTQPGGSGRPCKSCLFFPLRIGGRVIGAMSVQAYDPHAFPIEFRVTCRALSNQLAAALENARLMSEVSRKASDLATLQALTIDIASSLETDTVGGRICNAAVRFFGADHSGLVLFGEEDRTGKVIAEYPPRNAIDLVVPLEGVPDEQALIREQEPLIIELVANRETLGPVRDILLELGIQATLIVPVVAAGRLLGSFSIDYYRHHHFNDQDVDNARMFAAQVAVALDHARFFEDAVRSASQVRLLHKISDHIQTADEPEDIFHMVLTGVTADFGLRFNAAALFILDGDVLAGRMGIGHFTKREAEADWLRDEELELNEFDHYYDRLRQGEFRTNRTPLDQAVRALRLTYIDDDLLSDVIAHPKLREIDEEEGQGLPQSFSDSFRPAFPLIVAPLLTRGRVIGLLVADNRFTGQDITGELQDSLLGFADTAAVAIDNTRLRLETQQRLEEAQAARREAEVQVEKNARLVGQRDRIWSKATAVAAAVAQEELTTTLMAIAESSREALEADVVTVYAYDVQTQRFTDLGYSIINQRAPNSIRPTAELPTNSVLYDIIREDDGPSRRLHDETRDDPDLIRGEFVKSEGIHASVGLQIRGREGRLGVMFVNYRSPHHFEDDELGSIQHFANQAAAAIYGQQQYRNATRRARVLESLNFASRLISSAVTLEATLEQIAIQALTVVEAIDTDAACHVALKRGNFLQFAAASSPDILARLREEIGTIRLDTGGQVGIIGRAAITGESINSPYAPIHLDYLEFKLGTYSELAVPIKNGSGDVIGVINLEHPAQNYFSKENVDTVESLAVLAAAAMQTAQHLEQKRIVAEISARVNASQTLGEFLDSLFAQLVTVFRQRDVPVYPNLALYEPATEQLQTFETEFYPGGTRAPFVGLEEPGIIPFVARIGESYYAEDVNINPYYYRLLEDTQSEFATPVFYDGQLLAVLDLESPVCNAFSSDDIELLETLAHQIATTIHNVYQYEELRRTQAAVNARTMLIHMSVVTHRWGHRIRNQAQTIVDQVELLERDLQRPPSQQRRPPIERLQIITQLAEAIKRKPIKEPLDREKNVRMEKANNLLRESVAKVIADKSDSEDKELPEMPERYAAKEDECIAVNPVWFEMVIENIFENALQYVQNEPLPRIEIGTRRVGNSIEMYFADNGPGIPPDRKQQLIEEPIIKDPDEPGHGIGLFLAKLVMETYEGTIRADNNQPRGTIITLSFPCKSLGDTAWTR